MNFECVLIEFLKYKYKYLKRFGKVKFDFSRKKTDSFSSQRFFFFFLLAQFPFFDKSIRYNYALLLVVFAVRTGWSGRYEENKPETDNQEQNNKIVCDTISFWNSDGL